MERLEMLGRMETSTTSFKSGRKVVHAIKTRQGVETLSNFYAV
jgi:hypothetical protein